MPLADNPEVLPIILHQRILFILEKQKEELTGLNQSQLLKEKLLNNLDQNIGETQSELQQQTNITTKQEPLLNNLSVKNNDLQTGIIIGLAAALITETAVLIFGK